MSAAAKGDRTVCRGGQRIVWSAWEGLRERLVGNMDTLMHMVGYGPNE